MVVENKESPSSRVQRRNRSKLEVNFVRLLSRCEGMGLDTEGLGDNWRLEKYLQALEVMLQDLKGGPNVPEKDALLDYGRKIELIKSVIQTSKMPSLSEKLVASSQLIVSPPPGGCGNNVLSPMSSSTPNRGGGMMEIKQRHVTKYAEDARRELLGDGSSSSSSNGPSSSGDDIDDILKYHHDIQEKIAEHMIELTKSLKGQVVTAGQIIKNDVEVLDKSSKLMDNNQSTLKVEAQRLEMYNKSACKCWVWLLLFIVCSTFIGMVLFMRLFRKRIVVVGPSLSESGGWSSSSS